MQFVASDFEELVGNDVLINRLLGWDCKNVTLVGGSGTGCLPGAATRAAYVSCSDTGTRVLSFQFLYCTVL